MKLTQWQYRILKALGVNPFSPQAREDALAGVGKHSRASRPKRFWQKKRKARNLMARESRKINRRQTNRRRNKPSRRHT